MNKIAIFCHGVPNMVSNQPNADALMHAEKLAKEGFEVKTFDPYINHEEELESVLAFSKNIIIATHHKVFDSYDLKGKKVVVVGDK